MVGHDGGEELSAFGAEYPFVEELRDACLHEFFPDLHGGRMVRVGGGVAGVGGVVGAGVVGQSRRSGAAGLAVAGHAAAAFAAEDDASQGVVVLGGGEGLAGVAAVAVGLAGGLGGVPQGAGDDGGVGGFG